MSHSARRGSQVEQKAGGDFHDGFVSAEAMRVAAWSLFLKLTCRRKAMGLFSMVRHYQHVLV